MKRAITISLCCLLAFCASSATAQGYFKLNTLYAVVGVINPQFEFRLTPHSAFQTEIVFSPWKSINIDGRSKPMEFGILMNEYRYYICGYTKGWYVGGNISGMAFKMSKPQFIDGKFSLEDRYSKGYGFMIGAVVGYEHIFRERWVVDAYFGWAFMQSYYNGYSLDDEIDMEPHRPMPPKYPDPFNGSSEWYPNKIGVSLGVRIFRPR